MTKISVLMSTGSPALDRIFKGVFGQRNEQGNFTIDPLLRKIHLFNLTPLKAMLQESGVAPGAERFQDVEVPDDLAPALAANLIEAMQSRWLDTYTNQAGFMAQGLARSALLAERDQVAANVEAMQTELGVARHEAVLNVQFTDLPADYVCVDDEYAAQKLTVNTFFKHPDCLAIQAVDMAASLNGQNTNQSVTSADMTHATGSATISMVLRGDQQHHAELFLAMAPILAEEMGGAQGVAFHYVQWSNGPTHADQAACAPDAPAV